MNSKQITKPDWKGTKYESLVHRDKKVNKEGFSLTMNIPSRLPQIKKYNWMKDKKYRMKRYKEKPNKLPYYRKFYRNINVIMNGVSKRITEHAFVWMMHFEREYDPKQYVIHHVDDNRQNNHPSNLCLMTRSQHIRYHKKHMESSADTLYIFLMLDDMFDHKIFEIWDRYCDL